MLITVGWDVGELELDAVDEKFIMTNGSRGLRHGGRVRKSRRYEEEWSVDGRTTEE